MRTLFHRLGVGALLAGTAILGGCLSADKPIVKNRDNTQRQATTTGQATTGPATTGQTATGARPANTNTNNVSTGNAATDGFRTNNSVATPTDPNSRIGVNVGAINPAVNTTTGNQPLNNGVQPAIGFKDNSGNTDLKPIGTNVTNSNAIKPVTATNISAVQPPPDPPPTNNPMPVSLQGSDRDALRSGPAGLR